MANSQFRAAVVELDHQARVTTTVAESGLRAAQSDERRFDGLDVQAHRVANFQERVERALVGNRQQRVLVAGVELVDAKGEHFATRSEGQVAVAALFQFAALAAAPCRSSR